MGACTPQKRHNLKESRHDMAWVAEGLISLFFLALVEKQILERHGETVQIK